MRQRTLSNIAMIFFVILVASSVPIMGYFLQAIPTADYSLSDKNVHVLFAMGMSVAVTVFFGIQQRTISALAEKEYDLKQAPHVEFYGFVVKADAWDKIRLKQRIENIGLADVYLHSARLLWEPNVSLSKKPHPFREYCLEELPLKIPAGEHKDIEFEIKLQEILEIDSLHIESAWPQGLSVLHIIDGFVEYQLKNAAAERDSKYRKYLNLNELIIKRNWQLIGKTL